MKLTEFDVYRDLLKEKSGLSLSQDKIYLLESRLSPVAKHWGFHTLQDMTQALSGVPDPKLVNEIIEIMTTTETSFFRDKISFEALKATVIPYMHKSRAKKRNLSIWCAAASSGQEPYSIAMLIKELSATLLSGWSINILGTDISNNILSRAKSGLYSQFEVQCGLPIATLIEFFVQNEEHWEIDDDIKSMVEYRHFNLLDDMNAVGKHDIILCRNVLKYFDEATKTDVLRRIANQLEPDGFLFLGEDETVSDVTDLFLPVAGQHVLYAKPDSTHFKTVAAE